jgi:hypothetical protein
MNELNNDSQLLIYQTPAGDIKIDVRLENETVWLTQDHMAELFGKSKSIINEHIKNVFAEGELVENAVMKKFGISEFQQKTPNFYAQKLLAKVKNLAELVSDIDALKNNLLDVTISASQLMYDKKPWGEASIPSRKAA